MTGRYAAPRTELTPREIAVLMLVVEGWNNKSIGGRLGITMSTVEVHVQRIYDKMLGDDRRDDGKDPRVAVVLMYREMTRRGAA